MQRLIFVNRYFFPDHSATSQILTDLTFHLAAAGHEVHVIASRQLYDSPHAALPADETIEGVNVHRVASTRFGRTTLTGRALDYLSFYRSVRHRLGALARPGDTVIAKTDPPLLSVVLGRTIRRRAARLINWLQDIYPETAVVLSVPFHPRSCCSSSGNTSQSQPARSRRYRCRRRTNGPSHSSARRCAGANPCHRQLVR